MSNPVQHNPLRTRADMEQAAVQLLSPLLPLMSAGKARLHLGETGALYAQDIAQMEAFSRPLWAIVPMLRGKGPAVDALWPAWREGLKNGCDPQHAEYWGLIGDRDQRMVEMAVMGLGLMWAPERFYFDYEQRDRDNIRAWLWQVNEHEMPANNWVFFRVLVNLGFMRCGLPCDERRLAEDLALVEEHYEGDGWYADYPDQRDYYTFWGFLYYSLVYAEQMGDNEPERCHAYMARAREAARRFARWFDRDGHALPYGRSLSYRFCDASFFAALAVAGGESAELHYGHMKHILLGNLRGWLQRPIFTRDGLLTIGYGYPNLLMAEGYNAPGSPYWGMKAFAVLALPDSHPFWQAEEQPLPVKETQFLEPGARMLISKAADGSHVQAFTAGNHAEGHAHVEAKYEKFCYSTAFAFSVPKASLMLHQGAYDSMLAFSEKGIHWHGRYGVRDWRLDGRAVRFTWQPFEGLRVRTTLIPLGEWHIRRHQIESDRPHQAAEGAYAISRQMGEEQATVQAGAGWAYAAGSWGVSGIVALKGYGEAQNIAPEPNTNLLHPRTYIPTLLADIPAGEGELICLVLGAVTDAMMKWTNRPGQAAIDDILRRV